MATAIKVRRADVARIVDATFPEYKGRKIVVRAASFVMLHSLNWDGGSRNTYRACSTSGQPLGTSEKYNAMAPWSNTAEGREMPIPQGGCIVEHAIFFGKDAGLIIYMNLADMPARIVAA